LFPLKNSLLFIGGSCRLPGVSDLKPNWIDIPSKTKYPYWRAFFSFQDVGHVDCPFKRAKIQRPEDTAVSDLFPPSSSLAFTR
jgi:hypothetical protein